MKKLLLLFFIPLSQVSFSQDIAYPAIPSLINVFPNMRDFSITKEEDEAYFTVQSMEGELSVICYVKKVNGKWTKPMIAPFSGKYHDLEAFLSPDGLRLYYSSNRPLSDSIPYPKDFDIWYVERTKKMPEWSKPINLGKPVNSEHNEFYPSIANNKNLYFTSDGRDTKGKDDIMFCKWQNGYYSSPISLSRSINSEGHEFNSYISPDDSYLIFSGYRRGDGFGGGDLYISYKSIAGSWSKAENLGQMVNSEKTDYCPFVNPATQTLYFTSRRSNVSNPQEGFRTIKQLIDEVNQYENGLSRVYKISTKGLISSKR